MFQNLHSFRCLKNSSIKEDHSCKELNSDLPLSGSNELDFKDNEQIVLSVHKFILKTQGLNDIAKSSCK